MFELNSYCEYIDFSLDGMKGYEFLFRSCIN